MNDVPRSFEHRRMEVAGVILVAALAIPVGASAYLRAAEVNALMPWLLAAFVVSMLPEVLVAFRRWATHIFLRLCVLAVLVCCAAWMVYQEPSLRNDRFWLYAFLVPFFAAASAWFSRDRAASFRPIFVLKLAIALIAMAVLTSFLFLYPEDRMYLVRTPLLNHIRHINIEWVTALALAICYCSCATRAKAIAGALLFICFGYFTTLSGGRGAILALLLFVAVLLIFRRIHWREKRLVLAIAGFAVGALLVFATGQDQLASNQFSKLASSSADTLSSGRVHLWENAWIRSTESSAAFLCGLGPDAFRLLGVSGPMIANGGAYVMHPHNSILLWLIEFGVIGASCIVGATAIVSIQAIRLLRSDSSTNLDAIVAALFLAYCFYSLTDAIAYHAIPLTTYVILAAYISAASRAQTARRTVAT